MNSLSEAGLQAAQLVAGGDPRLIQIILLSLRVSLTAVLIATVVGLPIGAAIAVIPNLPLIQVLLVTQVINGLLLPVILFAILRLINNRELMGAHVNGPIYNIGAWLTAIIVTSLSLLLVLVTLFPNLFRS